LCIGKITLIKGPGRRRGGRSRKMEKDGEAKRFIWCPNYFSVAPAVRKFAWTGKS